MKELFYFIKAYKVDIIAGILSLSLTMFAFVFNDNPNQNIQISVIIIFLFLIVVIYLRARDKEFYYLALNKNKSKEDWLGSGVFEYSRSSRSFKITNADPGYVFNKCFAWSNYKMSFEFKIVKDCLGVLLRVVNLSNYVMMQIRRDGIRPHIRVNGAWRIWESKEVDLVYPKLSLDKWYKCIITCDKQTISVKILSKKDNYFDRQWKIPTGSLVFNLRNSDNNEQEDKLNISIPFSINLEYGSVGFRNSGKEEALIRNILVEKI